MQKTLFNFFILAALVLTISFCTDKRSSVNLDKWTGKYIYEEKPIRAIAGYFMTMTWALSIDKKGDSCQGLLEVNGQQTYIKLLADISGDTNIIAFTYNRLIDGSDENLKKGDTLFTLFKQNNRIKTKWMYLQPRLTDTPPKECDCFDITKYNGH